MARRTRRAPVSRRSAGKSGKTDIALWDYERLRRELMSRPAYVLRHFQRCQVAALDDLAVYREILQSQPAAAARIVAIAALHGIPERAASSIPPVYEADDASLGDVLGEDRGEV